VAEVEKGNEYAENTELTQKQHHVTNSNGVGGGKIAGVLPLPLALNGLNTTGGVKLSARDNNNVVTILNSARRSINTNTIDPTSNYSNAHAHALPSARTDAGAHGHSEAASHHHNGVITGSSKYHTHADSNDGVSDSNTNSNNNSVKPRRKSKEQQIPPISMSHQHAGHTGTTEGQLLPPMFPSVTGPNGASLHQKQPVSGKNLTAAGRIASANTSRVLKPAKYDQLVTSSGHVEELKNYLTAAELAEVKEFPGTLFFLGLRTSKKKPKPQLLPPSTQPPNSKQQLPQGLYDDESGSYIATNRGEELNLVFWCLHCKHCLMVNRRSHRV
jgi:hypothetical protein